MFKWEKQPSLVVVYDLLVGDGFPTHLKHIATVKFWIISPTFRGENKKMLEKTTGLVILGLIHNHP